ncbi:hypothetical protein TYRP_001051 [Tyrophagus putrescentiae]|nr:hypothetical protein TYRP_001051 [Tyrophagus putrescentiae]
MTSLFASPRACIILTGASRGFGLALATTFTQHYRDTVPRSTNTEEQQLLQFIVISRCDRELNTLGERLVMIDDRAKVQVIVADLASVQGMVKVEEELAKFVEEKLQKSTKIGHYLLLHNAGSTGNVKQRVAGVSSADSAAREAYYRLNLLSVMELTGLFLRLTSKKEKDEQASRTIVNVSSLAAVQAFAGLVDYCTGKAAREAYFRSVLQEIEEEEAEADKGKKSSSFRLLNYAPGPLETAMFAELQDDSLVSEAFQKVVPLKPTQSAEKLVRLLAADQFVNGAHVDYYDDE